MHEFSLAQNIIEIVEETIRKNNAGTVNEVVLEIGTLSGVEIPALDMALDSLQSGSVIEEAKIIKLIVKASARCLSCEYEFQPEDFFSPCPKCGNYGFTILKGKELRVKSITAE
jgi:hydrogenase nickel incorporation protein HypA/HybF